MKYEAMIMEWEFMKEGKRIKLIKELYQIMSKMILTLFDIWL